jgi:hypothetical protein
MSAEEPRIEDRVQSFGSTWKRVITDPHGFFADMPHAGGLQEPLVFLVVCAAVNAVGHMLVGMNIGVLVRALAGEVFWGFIFAALLVLIAQHLFDGRAGFEPTFRVVAYAAAPTVLAWVPRLGIPATLYCWYLTVRGLERVQEIDATRAVLAVLIGVVALLLVIGALAGHHGLRLG